MKVDGAREAAFRCVRAVDAEDAYANLAMPSFLSALGLTGRDAAFATELAYGALRMRGQRSEVSILTTYCHAACPLFGLLNVGQRELRGRAKPLKPK